jgi:hypothetical protein
MAGEHVAEPVDLAALVDDPAKVATVRTWPDPGLVVATERVAGSDGLHASFPADRDETVSSEDTLLTVGPSRRATRRVNGLAVPAITNAPVRRSSRAAISGSATAAIDRYLRNRTGR